MSWTEKKLLLPFMGADSRTRGQEETRENTGSLGREEPQVIFLNRRQFFTFFDKLLQVIRQAALRKFTSRNGVRKKW